MNLIHRRLLGVILVAIALLAASIVGPSASGAVTRGHDHGSHGGSVKLVVNTQLGEETSPVVKASGRFRSCTSVTDLYGDSVDLGYTLAFFGLKQINCDKGEVIVSYGVLLGQDEPDTRGHWNILVSTLPGVRSGGGSLFGDSSKCVELSGDEGCVLDIFTGQVH